MDDLDPLDPKIEEILQAIDSAYNLRSDLPVLDFDFSFSAKKPTCFQLNCAVYAQVVKSTQRLYLYLEGRLEYTWTVSTGKAGRETPNLNRHPDGRIYEAYTSTRFPGGNYMGLGNMPYAVFIKGGYAIHGTGLSNIARLGKPASHGCIRLHPEHAKIFNRMVRASKIENVWVSVQE